jgi:hypothetical protein
VEGRLLSAAVEPPRLLGLGDNTIDTYVSAGLQFPGGNAVNVAVMARRLGVRASYLGCWGDDAGGRILDEALAAEGVDLSHVRRIPGGETARARIAHENGDRRFVGARPGVRANYALGDVDLDFIANMISSTPAATAISTASSAASPPSRGCSPTTTPRNGPRSGSPRRCRMSISRSCPRRVAATSNARRC